MDAQVHVYGAQQQQDGFRAIIRAAEETEHEVRVNFLTFDSVRFLQIAEGMKAATGLPVRLVIRRRLTDGAVQETPWLPIAAEASIARGFAAVAIVALPYIGGIIIGFFLPRAPIIVGIGLALWVGQMLAVSAYAKGTRHVRKSSVCITC